MIITEFIVVREIKATPILSLETCFDLELINKINILNVTNDSTKFIQQIKDDFSELGCFPDIYKLK